MKQRARGHNRFFSTLGSLVGFPRHPQKHENRAYMYTKGREERDPLKTRRIKGTAPSKKDGEDVERRRHGLHSAFRERDTFYRGAPSLRQFAAHTKLCSSIKLRKFVGVRPPRFFIIRGKSLLFVVKS